MDVARAFDPGTLARTYRDPVAIAILAVDLFPIYAVLALGWGAAALVWLYWLENVILGAVALARMAATSIKEHLIGLLGMAFIGPFFIVHYGMFCFVHGIFVSTFADMSTGQQHTDFMTPAELVAAGLNSAPHMPVFVAAIIAIQVYLFARDYLARGQFSATTVQAEMMAPYARVIVLHIGIFAGAFALLAIGQPLVGILGLILLRAAWGMWLTVRRRLALDAPAAAES